MKIKPALGKAERVVESVAERNAKWLRSEDVKSAVTPRNILVLALVCLVGLAYCQGQRHAEQRKSDEQLSVEWSRWADSVNALTDAQHRDSLAFVSAIGHANTARSAYAKAVSAVTLAPQSFVPSSEVQHIVLAANEALLNDSTVHVASMALLTDLHAEVSVIEKQRDVVTDQFKREKRRPGWKTGAAGMLAVVIALALVLK